jgi:outer membrane protein OmpA-like peptidoglycan-associated protein
LATIELPVQVWDGTSVPSVQLTGAVTHTAFQSDVSTKPDIVAAALLQQLTGQGYTLALQCADSDCGGYDFKFALPIMPPPAMYVDLGSYTFLSAYKGKNRAVWLLASRSLNRTHLQITQISPASDVEVQFSALPIPTSPNQMAPQLMETGHFMLSDLSFGAGLATLNGNAFPSLKALADFLSAGPDQSIVLVGHTDSSGSHDKNIELSKQRAKAVRAMLLAQFPEIAPERVASEGLGYFAPVASNTTPEGREMNRRVEVILVPAN